MIAGTPPAHVAPATHGLPAACTVLAPTVVSRALGRDVHALSAALLGESDAMRTAHLVNCVYSYDRAPYRVVANLTIEAKPPGTAFARERIDELRAASDIDVRSVPKLPYGHLIRPVRGPGASLLFDAGTSLVTLTTPDRADQALLQRLARITQQGIK